MIKEEQIEPIETEAEIKTFDNIEALYETEDEFGGSSCFSWFEL